MGQNFHHLLIAEAGRVQLDDGGRADVAPVLGQFERKVQGRGGLRIGRPTILGGAHFFHASAGLAAQRRVQGQAIFAAMTLGHGDSDLFDQLRIEDTVPDCAE